MVLQTHQMACRSQTPSTTCSCMMVPTTPLKALTRESDGRDTSTCCVVMQTQDWSLLLCPCMGHWQPVRSCKVLVTSCHRAYLKCIWIFSGFTCLAEIQFWRIDMVFGGRSEEKLKQLQSSLGSTTCHLLRINTGTWNAPSCASEHHRAVVCFAFALTLDTNSIAGQTGLYDLPHVQDQDRYLTCTIL